VWIENQVADNFESLAERHKGLVYRQMIRVCGNGKTHKMSW
jgi:hypothetical protein